jgi:hypothetical protein
MRSFRRHLCALAVMTLVSHAGMVALGSLRVCWSDEHHSHAGGAAACPMHHYGGAQAPHPASHSHHAHGAGTAAVPDESEQMTCRCPNDPASPYLGLAGVVTVVVSVARSADATGIAAEHEPQPPQVSLPVHSPPPRTAPSSRS